MIPIKVMCDDDLERVNSWIRACLTLHNIFIRLRDEWNFEEEKDNMQEQATKEAKEDEADVSGKEFQSMVRDRWLEANFRR
jgi:hypothetical protein